MAHPRKTPYSRKNLADISYTSQVMANFFQISLPWQRVSMGVNQGKYKCHH